MLFFPDHLVDEIELVRGQMLDSGLLSFPFLNTSVVISNFHIVSCYRVNVSKMNF